MGNENNEREKKQRSTEIDLNGFPKDVLFFDQVLQWHNQQFTLKGDQNM